MWRETYSIWNNVLLQVMSWWDYGYQITAMANRTIIVDNNTWNNTHISRFGAESEIILNRFFQLSQIVGLVKQWLQLKTRLTRSWKSWTLTMSWSFLEGWLDTPPTVQFLRPSCIFQKCSLPRYQQIPVDGAYWRQHPRRRAHQRARLLHPLWRVQSGWWRLTHSPQLHDVQDVLLQIRPSVHWGRWAEKYGNIYGITICWFSKP